MRMNGVGRLGAAATRQSRRPGWRRVGLGVGVLILGGCAPGGCLPAPIHQAVGVTYQLTGTCVQAPLYPNPGQPCVGGDVIGHLRE